MNGAKTRKLVFSNGVVDHYIDGMLHKTIFPSGEILYYDPSSMDSILWLEQEGTWLEKVNGRWTKKKAQTL